jgi:hypothetical protein
VTKCYPYGGELSPLKRRKVEINFQGGDVTSDGGVVLLREMDKRLGLTDALDKALPDGRRTGACQQRQKTLLRQRIYALALGYVDLNDHALLRHDCALQTAEDEMKTLASAPTLCRLENRMDATAAVDMHKTLLDQFISSLRFNSEVHHCPRLENEASCPYADHFFSGKRNGDDRVQTADLRATMPY